MAMAAAKFWTLEELDSLPDDDGNRYEVIDGELFVTPAPMPRHEHVLARLAPILTPFVELHSLGVVLWGNGAVRLARSSVQPDLMVRHMTDDDDPKLRWEDVPLPILVVEILSPSTRRRDQLQKRDFYLSRGIPEYWMVDPDNRSISQVRAGHVDTVSSDTITWRPPGTAAELTILVSRIFGSK